MKQRRQSDKQTLHKDIEILTTTMTDDKRLPCISQNLEKHSGECENTSDADLDLKVHLDRLIEHGAKHYNGLLQGHRERFFERDDLSSGVSAGHGEEQLHQKRRREANMLSLSFMHNLCSK